ncbi:hypothetical protein, partial [Gordonia sp. UBA7860]|uniref:hypothetical protein n=1 Tax=Gordonia sp. UBA7860 TaxID=1946579 RepID=UPI00257D9888
NPPTIQPAEFSTQSQPERQKPDQTKTSNTQTQRPERHKINHHIIQKLGHTMPKYGIKQFITHYRVLKERTPADATPEKGLTSKLVPFGGC